jgi:AcrR family transcriptional regulator
VKLAQNRSIRTRQALLDAARELFESRGYGAATIDDIARRADMAKATVFAHFGDKQSLLAAIGMADLETLLSELELTAARGIPLEAKAMQAALAPWLQYFLKQPDFARLYLLQAGLVESPQSKAYLALCAKHEELLAKALAITSPQLSAQAQMVARGALAHFQQVLVYRLAGWIGDDQHAAEALNIAIEIWCAGSRAVFGHLEV